MKRTRRTTRRAEAGVPRDWGKGCRRHGDASAVVESSATFGIRRQRAGAEQPLAGADRGSAGHIPRGGGGDAGLRATPRGARPPPRSRHNEPPGRAEGGGGAGGDGAGAAATHLRG